MVEVSLYRIYLLDAEQISLTLFTADQILRLTNGEFNSLNLSRELGGDNTFGSYKINHENIQRYGDQYMGNKH